MAFHLSIALGRSQSSGPSTACEPPLGDSAQSTGGLGRELLTASIAQSTHALTSDAQQAERYESRVVGARKSSPKVHMTLQGMRSQNNFESQAEVVGGTLPLDLALGVSCQKGWDEIGEGRIGELGRNGVGQSS